MKSLRLLQLKDKRLLINSLTSFFFSLVLIFKKLLRLYIWSLEKTSDFLKLYKYLKAKIKFELIDVNKKVEKKTPLCPSTVVNVTESRINNRLYRYKT